MKKYYELNAVPELHVNYLGEFEDLFAADQACDEHASIWVMDEESLSIFLFQAGKELYG